MAKQLLGKPVADEIRVEISQLVAKRKEKGLSLGFAALRVGEDPASIVYQGRLIKEAAKLGFDPFEVNLDSKSSEAQVIAHIHELAERADVAGILVFMPLPKGLDPEKIASAIPPEKDVDCLNPVNFGQVMAGKSLWGPCTARAVMAMLDHYEYDLTGKKVVVIGRSDIVGRPLAQLLLSKNATVTICHSKTKDLAFHTRTADLVIPAVGKAGILTGDMLQEGSWVVDVGINLSPNGEKILGDAEFSTCEPICEAISPVPGGIGAISVVMILQAMLRGEI